MAFHYTVREVAAMCGALVVSETDTASACTHVINDSRSHFDPSGGVFFAIRGDFHDGHRFVADLATRGVSCFVVEEIPEDIAAMSGVSFLQVTNALCALQLFASNHRNRFAATVLGITGSNGKTIVKEWLAQLLSPDFSVIRSPLSYNSQVGVPLSVLQMQENHDLALFEAGISKPGEMESLAKIIKPTIGVFTGIGPAHDEHFVSRELKIQEKFRLFASCEVLICFNNDEETKPHLLRFAALHGVRLFTVGTHGDSDLSYTMDERKAEETSIHLALGQHQFSVTIPFADHASISNALLSLATLLLLGIKPQVAAARLNALEPVAMRMEQVEGVRNTIIINDSYNNDLLALKIALNHLKNNHARPGKSIILSDIFQSGLDKQRMTQEIAAMVDASEAEKFIGIGHHMASLKGQLKCRSWFYDSTAHFLHAHPMSQFGNEVILLKGARSFRFEKIRDFLQRKSHDTVLEISLAALVHNLNCFRSRLQESTRIMAMVKASSYGGGTYEIANMLQFHRVDYLAVAYPDEGVELREAGITLPIMVMNPERSAFDTMIDHGLEPELYHFAILRDFLSAVEKRGGGATMPYPVHIEMDTGMHRLGFDPADLSQLTDLLNSTPLIVPRTVFSHLATADQRDDDGFAVKQLDAFSVIREEMIRKLNTRPWFHVLNSAGIIRFPEAQYDMVRPGIGLYGISPFPDFQRELKHVGRLRTTISQLRNVSPGDSVGYNRSYVANQPMRMAVAAIGYADGFNRLLGNGVGKVQVNGEWVPVIGDVCMDMIMLDVTRVEGVSEGDEVVVFGENHPVDEIAALLKTIPYEVLTSVSSRVKRVFLSE